METARIPVWCPALHRAVKGLIRDFQIVAESAPVKDTIPSGKTLDADTG